MERTYDANTFEYRNLALAACMLTMKSPNKCQYFVDDCYLDYGQGWMWTTILCMGNSGTYQAINPAEWKRICFAVTIDELELVCEDVLADKFCPDK